jgi:phage head maturation protease
MATPRVMSKLNRCASMHVVELVEHGARSTLGVLVLGHLAEENEARPLQGFCNLDGVDDVVEWCAQVHHGDVRGILLWEWSILLLWKKVFERRARRAR